jgi:hypothetical protein
MLRAPSPVYSLFANKLENNTVMTFNAIRKTSLLSTSLLPEALRHPLNAVVAHQLSQSACFLLTAGSDVAAAYIASRLFRAALAGFSKLSRHDVVYSHPDPNIMTNASEAPHASTDRGDARCREESVSVA